VAVCRSCDASGGNLSPSFLLRTEELEKELQKIVEIGQLRMVAAAAAAAAAVEEQIKPPTVTTDKSSEHVLESRRPPYGSILLLYLIKAKARARDKRIFSPPAAAP
jgi:hypothetical protein